ncbi:MAG: HPr family phosphocarrier protein [Candidatus Omnitrophota bacterium]|nr:HPr family phosphocarrier protein [Candidatus Omnitrophota bacterium]
MLAEKRLVIKNKLGLHARPAALFVQLANKFNCDIIIKKGSQEVNGKSIMGILMLAAGKGSRIFIRANGLDAQNAIDELGQLLSSDLSGE